MNSAIASISSGTAAVEDDADAERLEPLREPRRVRVRDVAGDDLVADRQDRGEHRSSAPSMPCGILAAPGTYPRPV